ncbi:MAG: hypothetical protein IAI48_10260 [Candidatus Eremiobacteraeota bacterium]|nr:hypothetical protein [Candidatus Eremiobacteraeota bacterium]
MEALVVCGCRHNIVAHENGRCATPGCDCRNSRYAILDGEIDRLKEEHLAKLGGAA